jgi:hypothetical protein
VSRADSEKPSALFRLEIRESLRGKRLAAGVNDIVRVGASWECNMAVDYQTLVSALRQNDEVAKMRLSRLSPEEVEVMKFTYKQRYGENLPAAGGPLPATRLESGNAIASAIDCRPRRQHVERGG